MLIIASKDSKNPVLINLTKAPINQLLSIEKIDNDLAKSALFKFGIAEKSIIKIIRFTVFKGPLVIEFGDVSYAISFKNAQNLLVSF